MKNAKYYLISYYARLPRGGFGFSNTYYHVPADKEFDVRLFELQMASETGLKPNDHSIISRMPVTVEEYNHNLDQSNKEIYNKHS